MKHIKRFDKPHNPLFDVDKVIDSLTKEGIEFDVLLKEESRLKLLLKNVSDKKVKPEISISENSWNKDGNIYYLVFFYEGSACEYYLNLEELVKEISYL